ncbi:MAG: tRNA uracil 4-sulfurtransferase ThiI [Candidatus Hodarchaeota archaeon]
MPKYDTIITRYGEIGIKSERTRKRFEKILIKGIHARLRNARKSYNIRKERGRIFIDSPHTGRLYPLLDKIFGIVSFSPAITLSTVELDGVNKGIVDYARNVIVGGMTFAVRARRTGTHPYTSKDIETVAGKAILEAFDHEITVNLSKPDITIHAEIREKKAYIYHEVVNGPGGLPLTTQGKVVCMLSGGIDSPVASYLIMKRGSLPVYVYFHSYPYVDESPIKRVIDVVKKMKEYVSGYGMRIYIVPQGNILKAIIKRSPRKMLCILCRRSMYRLAEQIAERERAEAIVTGESLGQKASQTLRNLFVETYGMKFPILRPLIGLDKVEIELIAKKIDTYETSIRPTSCCTAVPKYPLTSASLDNVLDVERGIELNHLIEDSLESAEIIDL